MHVKHCDVGSIFRKKLGGKSEVWVLEHVTELRSLTGSQLHQKHQLSKGQGKYPRMLLKNLPQNVVE